MKKLLFMVLMLAGVGVAHAGDHMADYRTVLRSGTISCSTSTFTIVPSTIQVTWSNSRTAIIIQSSSTNTGNFVVQMSTSPTAPTAVSWGFTLLKSDAPWLISIPQNIFLWVKSTAASAENIYYTEFR